MRGIRPGGKQGDTGRNTEGGIPEYMEICREDGYSGEGIVNGIIKRYGLAGGQAGEYMRGGLMVWAAWRGGSSPGEPPGAPPWACPFLGYFHPRLGAPPGMAARAFLGASRAPPSPARRAREGGGALPGAAPYPPYSITGRAHRSSRQSICPSCRSRGACKSCHPGSHRPTL